MTIDLNKLNETALKAAFHGDIIGEDEWYSADENISIFAPNPDLEFIAEASPLCILGLLSERDQLLARAEAAEAKLKGVRDLTDNEILTAWQNNTATLYRTSTPTEVLHVARAVLMAAYTAMPRIPTLVDVEEVKQLCRDYSSRTGSVYIGDVEASLNALVVDLPSAERASPAPAAMTVPTWQERADEASRTNQHVEYPHTYMKQEISDLRAALAAASAPAVVPEGLHEAARLIALWLKDDDVQRAMNSSANRDAARKIGAWPDLLRDAAPLVAQASEQKPLVWLVIWYGDEACTDRRYWAVTSEKEANSLAKLRKTQGYYNVTSTPCQPIMASPSPDLQAASKADLRSTISNAIYGYGAMLEDHVGTVDAIARAIGHQADLQAGQDARDAALLRAFITDPRLGYRWRIHKGREQWQAMYDGETVGKWGEFREVMAVAMSSKGPK